MSKVGVELIKNESNELSNKIIYVRQSNVSAF